MLSWVPSNNVKIRKYKKIPISGERQIPDDLKDILDVGDIPKRIGVKCKSKATVVVEASPKKNKKQRKTKSKKSKPAIVDQDSEERTHNNVISEPISTTALHQVSTPTSSQVVPPIQHPTPNENDIFEIVLKNPILNLSQTPLATTIPISMTTIHVQFILVHIPTSSIPVSTTQPISTPIFTDSTSLTSKPISTSIPLETIVQNPPSSPILEHTLSPSRTFSTTNFENVVSNYKALIEMLTSANAKTFEDHKNLVREIDKKIEYALDKVKEVSENVNTILNDFQENSEARNIEKANAKKVHLQKGYLEEKLKDFKEKSFTDLKVNVASRLGKGKIYVISEEDLNANLAEEEKKAHIARDKEVDDLKAIKEQLDRKDVEKKNVEEIVATKMALFPK
ncbi:unnamed protein product [Lactuca virosa]|uniref:Uncharacterized protein n=1 Tax=Lactuca virosa TaxID=75947 RepID=A0AAU9NED5_9ASTR|nr:unnamed protein product [Lactuca virosa]